MLRVCRCGLRSFTQVADITKRAKTGFHQGKGQHLHARFIKNKQFLLGFDAAAHYWIACIFQRLISKKTPKKACFGA